MHENGFSERRWETSSMGDLLRGMSRGRIYTPTSSETIADAVMTMKEHGVSQLPVLEGEKLVGVVTESDLLSKMVEGRATLSGAVAEVMFRNVETVHVNDDARSLTDLFSRDLVALIVDDDVHLVGILTKMDLVDHLTGTPKESR
jgi:cystathionine beta-synthase